MRSLFFVGLFLWFPLCAAAITDEFTIRLFVGSDTEPPTTPTGLLAIPVSQNQIDLSWNGASDDVYVSGYRVYRDAVVIATTSLTSFIDTGLTASTTYTYTIDAFDYSLNVSSTSVPVATTTLSVPIVTPPIATTSSTGVIEATAVPRLRDLTITTDARSATVDFSSYGPTVYQLRFGRTDAYELGSVSGSVFKMSHRSLLTRLEPGTTYTLELTLKNNYGRTLVVAKRTFTTAPALVTDSPLSVTNLRATVDDDIPTLGWQNPPALDGVVRVVRSHLFYPQSPTDGVVVYEGTGERFTDEAVLKERSPYYYSVFVITPDGRVSAAAVVRVVNQQRATTGSLPPETATSTREGTTAPGTATTQSGITLDASNVFVVTPEGVVTLSNLKPVPVMVPISVFIPRNAVPATLKSILLSIEDPTNNNEVTVYLLKLRGDGTAYEASFMSSRVVGEGRLRIEVFDYELARWTLIERTVVYIDQVVGWSAWLLLWIATGILTLLILCSLGLFFWWFFLWRRRREDNQ